MKACNNVRFYIGDKNCYKKFICLVLINVVCCSSIKCMGNFYIIVFDIKKERKKGGPVLSLLMIHVLNIYSFI